MNAEEMFSRYAWQPYTQMKLAPMPLLIDRAEGVYLYTRDGKTIIDAIGSWWVNIHGHCHPYINQSISRQLARLEHVIYAGLAHETAICLSQRLAQSTQEALPRVFFSDNGSTAVEIAIKMAYQYFWNQGDTKRREFVTLGGGYHGDTFGAMSVGDRGLFHQAFAPLLFPCHRLPKPSCPFAYFGDESLALPSLAPVLDAFQCLCKERAGRICALILEPVIQGASSSFHFYAPALLRKLREICTEEGIFLIADEVFTGCGRTGVLYACQMAKIWPDLMTLSKGLSGGYLPIAATLATEEIYQGFYDDSRRHCLFHGHSMTANALACAAALASLELLSPKETWQNLKALENLHKKHLDALQQKPKIANKIKECRYLGSVGLVELREKREYDADFAWRAMQYALHRGVFLRPLGSVIYLTPPYCIEEEALEKVYDCIAGIIQDLA